MARAREELARAPAVVPHTDADGLAAGAIALCALGAPARAAVLLRSSETPFDASRDESAHLLERLGLDA